MMLLLSQARYFNLRLSLGVGLIALSSVIHGFDNQAFATAQSMDAFIKQFGVANHKTQSWKLAPSWLSMFNSLNYIIFAAGVFIGSFVSSRFGRRWCIFSMSCYALISATICVTSTHREQAMAARVLNYVYIGMELTVIPTYQSEIVPAPARGLVVSTYQLSIATGGLYYQCHLSRYQKDSGKQLLEDSARPVLRRSIYNAQLHLVGTGEPTVVAGPGSHGVG